MSKIKMAIGISECKSDNQLVQFQLQTDVYIFIQNTVNHTVWRLNIDFGQFSDVRLKICLNHIFGTRIPMYCVVQDLICNCSTSHSLTSCRSVCPAIPQMPVFAFAEQRNATYADDPLFSDRSSRNSSQEKEYPSPVVSWNTRFRTANRF